MIKEWNFDISLCHHIVDQEGRSIIHRLLSHEIDEPNAVPFSLVQSILSSDDPVSDQLYFDGASSIKLIAPLLQQLKEDHSIRVLVDSTLNRLQLVCMCPSSLIHHFYCWSWTSSLFKIIVGLNQV
jgi:hypothetical protein